MIKKLALFGIFSLVLVWRIGDFWGEFLNRNFHITYDNFVIKGIKAEVIQIIVILILCYWWMFCLKNIFLNLTKD